MADDLSDQDIFDSVELTEEETKPEGEQPTGDRPRDEQGRFAPKKEPEPEPEAPQPQATQPSAPEEPKSEPPSIPPGLLEERRRRQEAEQRAQAAERQAAELQGFLRGQQRPQEQPKPQEPPDLFVNPDGFMDVRFQQYAQQHITPLQKQMMEDREYYSARLAEKDYGKEAVTAARQWIEQQVQSGDQEAQSILQRSISHRDPYGYLVQQYQQRQAIQQVGTDPNAWFEQELERRFSDPTFQQKVAQKLGPATPQGRSAPLVSIPSINRASGSAATPNDNVPGTEEELFQAAPRRMGRRD